MNDMQIVVDRIAQQTTTRFSPASAEDLSALRTLGLPESVMTFFGRYAPEDCAEGKVRLWPIAHILEENRDYVPGVYIAPLGYIVFASTMCGDAYCFNLNDLSEQGEPAIVLISHEMVPEDITVEEVARVAKPIAKTLYEFLDRFTRNEIDEVCIY